MSMYRVSTGRRSVFRSAEKRGAYPRSTLEVDARRGLHELKICYDLVNQAAKMELVKEISVMNNTAFLGVYSPAAM